MDTSQVPVRYGKALFKAGQEQVRQEEIFRDVLFLSAVLTEIPALQNILESQVIKPSVKSTILKELFEKNLSGLTMNFLLLLIKNKREARLRAILHYYTELFRKARGIALVKLTIPAPVNAELTGKIEQIARDLFHVSEVELSITEDPSLIGGFILQSGDLKADASVSGNLKKMRRYLRNKNK